MNDLRVNQELLPGVYLIDCPHHPDSRGYFSKLYHRSNFLTQGIDFTPAEIFVSTSNAGVLRGMHFQEAQAAHDKLVVCLKGCVLDVIVDVRVESPYFNKPASIELSEENNSALLISKGYAHGFYAYANQSTMLYATSTIHCPSLDRGILWSSIDFRWPNNNPILSERDSSHPPISGLR
jgi:dTDP-4-dehydrorhamnose 3,5-epimerase